MEKDNDETVVKQQQTDGISSLEGETCLHSSSAMTELLPSPGWPDRWRCNIHVTLKHVALLLVWFKVSVFLNYSIKKGGKYCTVSKVRAQPQLCREQQGRHPTCRWVLKRDGGITYGRVLIET